MLMTLNDPILRELFEEEAAELLDGIEALLPTSADAAALGELCRCAHTLKGSAGVMGVGLVSGVAATLEELFEALRAHSDATGPGIDDAIRAAVADLRYLVSGVLADLDVGSVAVEAEQSLRSLQHAITGAETASAPSGCTGCARLETLVKDIADSQARMLRLVEGLVAARPPASRKGRLVVVDDSRSVRERHRSILSDAGHDVRVAADGAAALELLSEGAADVVITDLDMPVMDGLLLTQSIRGRSDLQGTPVLVVTSHGDDATRERLIGAGANACVAKDSIDSGRLLNEVDKLLERAL